VKKEEIKSVIAVLLDSSLLTAETSTVSKRKAGVQKKFSSSLCSPLAQLYPPTLSSLSPSGGALSCIKRSLLVVDD
jgi:hypothetical protein